MRPTILSLIIALSPESPPTPAEPPDMTVEPDITAEPDPTEEPETDETTVTDMSPEDAPASEVADPEDTGCTMDTDCKGARVCDAVISRCIDPIPPAPQAVVQARDDSPPPWHRTGPVATHHPYVAGGVLLIVLGTVGVVAGGAWLGVYRKKVDAAARDTTTTFGMDSVDEFAALSARAPKVSAGTGILISTGGVLFVTGIILTAVKRPVRVSVGPSGTGLALRF
jgi:hypothetical protein